MEELKKIKSLYLTIESKTVKKNYKNKEFGGLKWSPDYTKQKTQEKK